MKRLAIVSAIALSNAVFAANMILDDVVVIKGSMSDQDLNVLASFDQEGSEDDWDTYIEFAPNSNKFVGEFTFALPYNVFIEDVESISVNANFMGEAKESQRWVFKIRDQYNSAWVTVGDNAEADYWTWQEFWFYVSGNMSHFFTNQNEVIIRYQSNNAVDVSNLDYLGVEFTTFDTTEPPEDDSDTPDVPPNDESETPEDPTSWWSPSPADALTWQWQLQGSIDHSVNVDVYDVDLFDVSANEIAQLKNEGRTVICYFSAGTYEGWRPDWEQYFDFINGEKYEGNKPPFAGKMDDWDERWLDIRRIDLLTPIMTSRLDMAVEKGCDAVEPDNMDAWTNNSEVRVTPALTGQDQLNYNRWLAEAAHDRGLSIGLKNDVDQLDELVDYFDWALNEQCFQYKECDGYRAFTQANKAVFGVEYQGNPENFCAEADQLSLFWMKKKLSLNAWRQGCEDY